MSLLQSELKSQQYALALALARGQRIKEAAAATGYCREHAGRLTKKRKFQRLVTRLRDQLTKEVAGLLTDCGRDAVEQLRAMLKSESMPPQVRFACGKALLELQLKFRDAAELAETLDKIERRMQELSGGSASVRGAGGF